MRVSRRVSSVGNRVAAILLSGICSVAFGCDSGAEVQSQYCDFFKAYRPVSDVVDQRVASRISDHPGAPTRSIALIVGIGRYPNLGEGQTELKPASHDVKKLTRFLVEDQKFDEVIVLEDEDVTSQNLNYFLSTYLPQRGYEYNKNARLLIAYSGHGVNQTPTSPAAFVLGDASGFDDTAHLFPMSELRLRLENLSNNYFHLLALVNACYGGNTFGSGNAGSPNVTDQPGSYVLTAGSEKEPVVSLGGSTDGSIFFDSIIKGISNGLADPEFMRIVAKNGRLAQQGGITRLGALAVYLDTEIEILNNQGLMFDGQPLRLESPWIGAVQTGTTYARGGFFFLSPIKLGSELTSPIALPAGPLSSVPGRPDLKIFGAQEEYPIRGIDVSIHEDSIDWKRVKQTGDYRFAYVRSSSWAGIDKSFAGHWTTLADVGMDRGAYHVFNLCLTPEEQFKMIITQVPKTEGALPIAINVQIPENNFNRKQQACWNAIDIKQFQQGVLQLAELLYKHYEQVPIIYGNRHNLNRILDKRFDRYMVWLAIYRDSGKVTAEDLGLEGSNPWTLWQFTGNRTVPGIGHSVDVNVFFGSEQAYKEFKSGRSNTALEANKTIASAQR